MMTDSSINLNLDKKPSLLNIFYLEAKTETIRLFRTPGFSIPTLLFPVMFYTFFGIVFSMNPATMPTYLMITYAVFGVIGPALFSFGVGIVIEAKHQCMTTRGIHKSDVSMVTSQMVGSFRKDARTRVEFLRMIDANR